MARNRLAAAGAVVALGAAALYLTASNDRSGELDTTGPPRAAQPTANPLHTPTPTPEPSETEPADPHLLPNLASLPPEDVLIEVVGGERQLRFTSIIANTGAGPIETAPDDEVGCPPEQRHASQRIYLDMDGDGQFDRDVDVETTIRPAGCMLDHPGHNHWHFDTAARYVLTAPGSDVPIASADKVSFCWRDNREVPAEADPPHEAYYGDCGYDEVQGITPGWADVYGNELDDQHLDLPADLADGTYCLWNEADPRGLLVESDDEDNAAVTEIELAGTDVETVPATVCATSPQP